MTAAPSRLGLAFALTLALPAAFAGVWAWLTFGGTVERALASERAAGERALSSLAQSLASGLAKAAATDGFVLQLSADGLVTGPFASRDETTRAETVTPSVAEQTAGAHTAANDAAGALSFYVHAADTNALSPEGWLGYARVVATTDVVKSRAIVRRARERLGDVFCGAVPFALLCALQEATWLRADTGATAELARVAATALEQAARLPAAAVPPVAAAIADAIPALADDPRLAALQVAARVALQFAQQPAPTAAAPGPDGAVLVPQPDRRLAVLPRSTVDRLRGQATAETLALHRGIALQQHRSVLPATAPSLVIRELGATFVAEPTGTPASALLAAAARVSLVLALTTLVLGNLLLWRLARRELALARMRRDFVDLVSHELRTPLAALSLRSEMLASGDVPTARLPHYLRTLHADVRRLDDQVQHILDFARLEKGAPLRSAPLPGRALLAHAVRAGRPALRLVGQKLDLEVPRALPAVAGDLEVLTRALRNLLENAAKYAPAGSTVTVRAVANARELTVEIADQGPGVPAAERRTIFEPFVRGRSAPDGSQGSGLGLALVAAAARAHRGSVAVHERPGGGAVFTLTLPVTEPSTGPSTTREAAS